MVLPLFFSSFRLYNNRKVLFYSLKHHHKPLFGVSLILVSNMKSRRDAAPIAPNSVCHAARPAALTEAYTVLDVALVTLCRRTLPANVLGDPNLAWSVATR